MLNKLQISKFLQNFFVIIYLVGIFFYEFRLLLYVFTGSFYKSNSATELIRAPARVRLRHIPGHLESSLQLSTASSEEQMDKLLKTLMSRAQSS